MFYLLKTLFFIDVLMGAGLLLFRWALLPRQREIVSARIAALALLTPAVALFCGNIYLFCLYLIGAVLVGARGRADLAGGYLFLLPLLPPLEVETAAGGVYLFSVSVLGAMGLGALLGYVLTLGRRAPTLARYDLGLVALVALFVFIPNHQPTATSVLRWLTINVLLLAGPYFLLSRAARTPAELAAILLRLAAGATLMAVTAGFQARRHWVLFESYYSTLHVARPLGSAATAMRAGMLRTGGSMVDYSAGGLFLAAIVTVMPLLRGSLRPLGFWAVQAVLIGGLIATQSRGAWLAAIVGATVVSVWRGRWTLAALSVGGAVAALVAARIGAVANLVDAADKSGTGEYRNRLFARGLDQVAAHPLIGQPLDQLIANLRDLTQGQGIVDFVNGHLYVAMAAGVPAFALWCGLWLMPLVETWRRRRGDPGLAAVPAALIVPSMVALIFMSIIDSTMIWPTVALALAPACLAFTRRRPVNPRAMAAASAAPPALTASLAGVGTG